MEKFIMAGSCATRVTDSVKGDCVIVLLHGYLESLDIWEEFAERLTPHARVITIDLPGHGISEVKGETHTMAFMADVVHGAMDKLGVQKALIVGHSMGGYVALEFIKRYPEAAAGVVLLHSTANADTESQRINRKREIEVIRAGKKDLIALSFPHIGFAAQNRQRMEDEIEDLKEQIVLTDDDGIIAALNGMSEREDNNQALRESKVPQLAIFGRGDEYVTVESAEAMVADHPQLKVVWLGNSGHMGFLEEPELCAEALLSFLKEVC